MKDEVFQKLMGKAAEDLNLLKVGCENMEISDAIFDKKRFGTWFTLCAKHAQESKLKLPA